MSDVTDLLDRCRLTGDDWAAADVSCWVVSGTAAFLKFRYNRTVWKRPYSVEKVSQPNFVMRQRSERSLSAGVLSQNYASPRWIERKLPGFQKRRLFNRIRPIADIAAGTGVATIADITQTYWTAQYVGLPFMLLAI